MNNIINKLAVGVTAGATIAATLFLNLAPSVPVAHASTDVSATDVGDTTVKAEHPNSNYGSDVFLESSGDVGHSDGDAGGSHTCVSTTSSFPDQCNHQFGILFQFPTITATNTVSSLKLKLRKTVNAGQLVCVYAQVFTSGTRWGASESNWTYNGSHVIEYAHPANPNQGDIDTSLTNPNLVGPTCVNVGNPAGSDITWDITGHLTGGTTADQLSGKYMYVQVAQYAAQSSPYQGTTGAFNHGDSNGNNDYLVDFASKERTSANTYCSDNNCGPKLDLVY